MSLVESVQPAMEEESFIILGSTPTPSMDNYSLPPVSSQTVSVVACDKEVLAASDPAEPTMETSTQLDSATYSLLPNNCGSLSASVAQLPGMPSLSESSKALLVASAEQTPSQQPASVVSGKGSLSLQSIENKENIPCDTPNVVRQATASFIIGETQSILHQFPSLSQSTVSIEEIHLLQKLSMEHSQLKESLQRANIAMRKNFTSIQQLQDETKARSAEQETRIAELERQTALLTAENMKLMDENRELIADLDGTKAAATEKETQIENACIALQVELEEVGRVRDIERKTAQLEVDELRKESSERQSIIQNLAKQIENLELQIKGFVVVGSNNPEKSDNGAHFVSAEVHKHQIKALERRMSVEVAKNLEFEDMRKVYVDEINCMKANIKAAEQVYAQSRLETQHLYDDIKARDDIIEHLRERARVFEERGDVLAAQSEIFQKDFEAERAGRQELASEKSRILAEFEVLQRLNMELTKKASITETERQQHAQSAAQLVQVATNSQETASSNKPAENNRNEPLSLLRCPLCLKGFKEFATLQSHAAFCMGTE